MSDATSGMALTPTCRRRSALRRMHRFVPALRSGAGIVLPFAVWQLYIEIGSVPSYVVPSLVDVAKSLHNNAGYLWSESLVTIQEVLLGLALSIGVGVALGVAIVSVRMVEKAIFPILVSSQVVPKIALAPLLLIWFGFGITSKVVITFLISFFPLVVATVTGLRAGATDHALLARSMGAGWLRTFVKVRLPGALPVMFGGLRLTATFAVGGAVIGEYVGADRGVGHLITLAAESHTNQGQTALVFSGILFVAAIGLVLFGATVAVERVAIPWYRRSRSVSKR
jgi:NitT/TauT family transport system permease protein